MLFKIKLLLLIYIFMLICKCHSEIIPIKYENNSVKYVRTSISLEKENIEINLKRDDLSKKAVLEYNLTYLLNNKSTVDKTITIGIPFNDTQKPSSFSSNYKVIDKFYLLNQCIYCIEVNIEAGTKVTLEINYNVGFINQSWESRTDRLLKFGTISYLDKNYPFSQMTVALEKEIGYSISSINYWNTNHGYGDVSITIEYDKICQYLYELNNWIEPDSFAYLYLSTGVLFCEYQFPFYKSNGNLNYRGNFSENNNLNSFKLSFFRAGFPDSIDALRSFTESYIQRINKGLNVSEDIYKNMIELSADNIEYINKNKKYLNMTQNHKTQMPTLADNVIDIVKEFYRIKTDNDAIQDFLNKQIWYKSHIDIYKLDSDFVIQLKSYNCELE